MTARRPGLMHGVFLLMFFLFTANTAAAQFVDDFNRPDGAVGNGWSMWGNGAAISSGQLTTFGAEGQGGGIFRTLPVTFPVSFAFDLRNYGDWVIEFNDSDGQQTGTAEFELYQQAGGLAYYYHTSSGQVGYYGTVVEGVLRRDAPAHVSGTVQANLSSSVTITYADGTHATVSTPAPADAVIAPQGSLLALGNAQADFGPYSFDNLVITDTPPVQYAFVGFFAPVDNGATVNGVKAGAAVPVKFSLGGNQGLNIFAAGYPRVQLMQCDGNLIDVIEETVNAGSSSLSYDSATGRYTYVWKTDKSWANSCRQLQVKFTDSQVYTARFTFR